MFIKWSKIFILFFNACTFVKLTNYLSVLMPRTDDCTLELKINNNIVFQFNPVEIISCMLDEYHGTAKSGDFILLNYEYKYNDKLEFTFGDYDHTEGWVVADIFFNEYKINTKDRVFWKCNDCGHEKTSNYFNYSSTYVYWMRQTIDTSDRLYFYPQYGDGSKIKLYIYHFDFVINDITDLFKGGITGSFEVDNNFYSFTSKTIFNFTIFSSQDELELINFNVSENFHVASNSTLLGDYTLYYFQVEYFGLKGTLK